MKKEAFKKAIELDEQIKRLKRHIYTIKGIIRIGNDVIKREKGKVNYLAKLRFLNMENKKTKQKEASVILFDNNEMNVYGYYDIEVDEEFLNYLSAYFESKKDELEKEFEKLG